jgi:hypothetical protein
MFAGYIAGHQAACVVDHMGFPELLSDLDKNVPVSFGGGHTLGIVGWSVLRKFLPDLEIRSTNDLGMFMDAVCSSAAPLGTPVNLWRITQEGWDKVDRTRPAGAQTSFENCGRSTPSSCMAEMTARARLTPVSLTPPHRPPPAAPRSRSPRTVTSRCEPSKATSSASTKSSGSPAVASWTTRYTTSRAIEPPPQRSLPPSRTWCAEASPWLQSHRRRTI